MNYLVPILDQIFKERMVAPSACISTSSSNYFLIEDDKNINKCIFVEPSGASQEDIIQIYFSVYNQQHKEIHLWAVDGCFMSPKVGSRCDCALFTANEFIFVEFKLNATTSNVTSILGHRIKASDQIEATIILVFNALKQCKITLKDIIFEGYICSPPSWPSKDTSLDAERIRFLETYGVSLFEKSEKSFS